MNYLVYVYWINDNHLDSNNVDRETAGILKARMTNSRCLFYVTTENSPNSKWMTWELEYFNGIKNKVVILPIRENQYSESHNGQK